MEEVDIFKMGELSPEQLSSALSKCGLDVSPSEAAQLMPPGFGEGGRAGAVAYKELVGKYSDACNLSDDAIRSMVTVHLKKEHGSMLKAFQSFDADQGRGMGKLSAAQVKPSATSPLLVNSPEHRPLHPLHLYACNSRPSARSREESWPQASSSPRRVRVVSPRALKRVAV